MLLLALFALALGLSASFYPGGTFFDLGSQGFSFWGNYWCDLLHERALNRAPNETSRFLARAAFWLFGAALMRFWPLSAELGGSQHVARWVTSLGVSGALSLLFVTIFSSRTEPVMHAVFVVLSALLGVIAASVLSIAMYRATDRFTRFIALAMIASALVSVGQYVAQGFGAAAARWLPGAQKITTVLLLAFMLRCSVLLQRRQRARAAAERAG